MGNKYTHWISLSSEHLSHGGGSTEMDKCKDGGKIPVWCCY